ncbi:hypothetical protein JOD02_001976 [Caldicoprobacter guelmensis]|nr:hypothetical protein [Caldicoprobacter guelmensis]
MSMELSPPKKCKRFDTLHHSLILFQYHVMYDLLECYSIFKLIFKEVSGYDLF